MPTSMQRDRFTWLLYLMLAYYGYLLNILGPITPYLKDELHISYTVSSLHFTAFAAGILLVGFAGHLVINRFGRWQALWLGAAGMSISALLLIAGRSAGVTIGASFLMGSVGSLILAVVPAALSDRHKQLSPVALSEANVIASSVSMVAPLLVGFFALTFAGWRLAIGTIVFTPLILYVALGRGGSTPEQVIQTPEMRPAAPEFESQPLPRLFWVYWVALVLAVSIEFCMVFWSADYLENALSLPTANAAQAVSLFLGAMVVGRLAGSRLVARFSTPAVITVSILVASLGFLLFWLGRSALTGLSGLFLTGLGVASMYPLILSLAIDAAPSKDQASARAALASGTAILALPLVLGRLADAVGIGSAFGVVAVLLLGVFLIVQLAGRMSRQPQPASAD